jgi:OTU domain-containing protein 6
MGRKGMKGFMKSATRLSNKPDEEEATDEQAAAPAAAGSKGSSSTSSSQPKAAEPDSKSKAAGSDSGEEGENGKETRGKMLQRHKRVSQFGQPFLAEDCFHVYLRVYSRKFTA